jgi:hypothetical protein
MSHDELPLRDVTSDTENTASSINAFWTVFTELLPGIASFTIWKILQARMFVSILCGAREMCFKFKKSH